MTNEISIEELEKILARCNAATSGPWKSYLEGRDHESGSDFIMTGNKNGVRGNDIELTGATKEDQEFIAHAKQDIPNLVAEIKRLRGIK